MATSPRERRESGRDEEGFTLVELLVVIAIIGALAALMTPMVGKARRSASVKAVTQEVQRLTVGLELFQSDYGEYPPTELEQFYAGFVGDKINSGVESLVGHLASQNKSGPYFEFKEDYLANLDEDRLTDPDALQDLNWIFGDDQLREYCDEWGNPYVYINSRDYETGFTVFHLDGQRTTALAGRSEKTANYHSLTTFQIWSCGPNGKNENGEGDDIGSWD